MRVPSTVQLLVLLPPTSSSVSSLKISASASSPHSPKPWVTASKFHSNHGYHCSFSLSFCSHPPWNSSSSCIWSHMHCRVTEKGKTTPSQDHRITELQLSDWKNPQSRNQNQKHRSRKHEIDTKNTTQKSELETQIKEAWINTKEHNKH